MKNKIETENEKLIGELNQELRRTYHNATLGGTLRTDSDYESDLYQSELNTYIEIAFEDLKMEFPKLDANYGPFYSYGRGGRTVAPDKLIRSTGGGSFQFKTANDLDLCIEELKELVSMLKSFNDYIYYWCSETPDLILKELRLEHAGKIELNKGKTRRTRTVVSYE